MQQNGSGSLNGPMNNDMLGPPGQQLQKRVTPLTSDARRNVHNNVSVQTGEEFSFLQDHVSVRNVNTVPNISQNYENRAGFDHNQNQNLGYEDLARILGLKRMDSEHPEDISEFVSAKGSTKEFENGVYGSKSSGQERMSGDSFTGQNNTNFGVCPGWNGLGAVASSAYAVDSPRSNNPNGSEVSEGSQPGRIKFICSFGGKILPRPSDGKLRYVGGETRIISIRKNLSWEELMKKTTSVCKQPHTIKYQLPGEDLDALISVSSDEDLQNMIEEYQGPERAEGSQRLKIFLIPLGESENSSSFEDGTIQQNNPDYEYVVAVNGVVDPSPRKTSGGQVLVHPSFPEKSPASTHPLEIKGDFSFSHHTQFYNDSQNITRPCNPSPPFSTVPPLREESNSVHKQSNIDNACQGSNESSSSFITAQQPPEKSSLDATGYNHLMQGVVNLINCQHHGNQIQPHQPNQQVGVHIHNHNPILENASNFGRFSGEISTIIERPFHSEKPPSHTEDLAGLLSAFSGPADPNFGIPHAFSDSKLQEQGVHAACISQERTGPYFPLDCAKTQANPPLIADAPRNEPLELCTISGRNYHSTDKLLDMESIGSQRNPDLLYLPYSKLSERNEQVSIGHQDGFSKVTKILENDTTMRQVKCEDSLHTFAYINGSDERESNWHQNRELNGAKLPKSVLDYSQHCGFSGTTMSPKENDNSWTRNCEASYLFPSVEQLSYGGKTRIDVQSEVPIVQFAHGSPIRAPLPQYMDTLLQESELSSTHDQAGPSPKQKTSDLPQELRFPSKNVLFIEDVSLPDNVKYIYPDCKMEKLDFVASDDEFSNMGDDSSTLKTYNLGHYQPLKPESENTERDASNTLPAATRSSSAAALYTLDNPSYEILSPTATNAESVNRDSESEDVKGDDKDDASISDALIAEMEASIYGLQIIRNADLEELQELGSGTYGTVYHGKWRGTDVAIKRIKKSCFAGRSSQQERLIKDFWREAQIISNLHHPNVVAFYGVVPDGTGETLATVTEYMVNGSLRHVLLKKDRSLDRRKKLMIAMDAAFGMEYLHSKNIVHFDLKCDNLLVNLRDPERPVCKVGDFGLSKIKRNTLVSGGVRGTLPWMAPELLNGSSIRVSEKVDIYSFGICMWEIFTGEEPYADMHCGAIIGGIVKNTLRPPIPEKCDPGWKKLMGDCWSANPASRPSFTEITKSLRTMSAAIEMKAQQAKSRKMKSIVSS